ncbi:penicillin-binding protein [Gloeomargarita lithophora Alchichica-D10]|uniref:Penicillin-binding protein n=1 Tax=Gloeomargarita lithophora Alchichica-D10 TaxID=1188229 RepID=A0A1J0AD98_9CYAN|nr:transglycosylase domain-containing protein [Gloeomargarita lithophora]APB33909.1 penicillin-binding protein [Gloeomargarita lithophora Alchichica-D10]
MAHPSRLGLSQLIQTFYAGKAALKPQARVPQLYIYYPGNQSPEVVPLVGEQYLLGRSTRSCDIAVRSDLVSQVHGLLQRRGRKYVLVDQKSTNGIYRGRRPIQQRTLRHGDRFTLGPPELAEVVRLVYVDPPRWYMRSLGYALWGVGCGVALGLGWVAVEWQKFAVTPLPAGAQGALVILSGDGQTPLRSPWNQDHQELARLEDFSPYLPQAVVASEDSRFYWHPGVDPVGVVRAVGINLLSRELREGASTITQQVARSLFREYVGTADSAGRKLREMVVALKLEAHYDKKTILTVYLNKIYLGVAGYGFEDAAQFYFAKSARNLSIAEAATLVGMLPAPNQFNPVKDYDTALGLRNRVIDRMEAQGMITAMEAKRARRSRIEISPRAKSDLQSTIAPYFYDTVLAELPQLLGKRLAEEGNFIIDTALDMKLQKRAADHLARFVATYGSTYGFDQGALVTISAQTGAVKALVGGKNYQQSQYNRITQAQRQPGSVFKVFVYGAALAQGMPVETSYECTPLGWQGVQFDGCRSGGTALDLTRSLALSENVVALRLAQAVGLAGVARWAKRLGIGAKLEPVPGLVLGQSEVTPWELTGAFTALANQGIKHPPHTITRIRDSSDCTDRTQPETCRELYRSPPGEPVIAPEVAATLTAMLQTAVASGTGRGAFLGRGEAGKTGTTNEARDMWFVGYLPGGLVTGIWLGNDNNQPTEGGSGLAAQLWGEYMGGVPTPQ